MKRNVCECGSAAIETSKRRIDRWYTHRAGHWANVDEREKKERWMRDGATGLAVELKNYVDIAGMIASDTFTQMDACTRRPLTVRLPANSGDNYSFLSFRNEDIPENRRNNIFTRSWCWPMEAGKKQTKLCSLHCVPISFTSFSKFISLALEPCVSSLSRASHSFCIEIN